MARYIGPICKLCRREGRKLFLKGDKCLTDKCPVEKGPSTPGVRGRRRTKESQYLIQFREKQKTKRSYGLLENQFKNYYRRASQRKGITGEVLLQLLERRLDNVIYRSGFATSRTEARQVVRHGHIMVNGQKVDIPSYELKEGDVVMVKPASKEVSRVKENLQSASKAEIPSWLELDEANLTCKVSRIPSREEIDMPVQEQLIVELYSR
jgi:small subunit ribosomal protein S4